MTAVEIDGRGKLSAEIAHMVPQHTGKCRRLHGHSVSLSVRVEADQLDQQGFVLDFTHVKPMMKELLEQLDHHTLLADHSYVKDEHQVRVETPDKHYSFPEEDVVILPVFATTAEEMAKWAGTEIWKKIPEEDQDRITYAEVTFWETENTGATFVMWNRRE